VNNPIWIEGDTAWEIRDQLATKYTGQPHSREHERVVAIIEPVRQSVGIGWWACFEWTNRAPHNRPSADR
jgi:hypothetical protein